MRFLPEMRNMHLACLALVLIQNLHTICAQSDVRNLASRITNIVNEKHQALAPAGNRNTDSYVNLSPAEIIVADGYPVETHTVTTEDGYILTLFRIPGAPGSSPVLLQHGLLESSVDWVIPGRGKSLAYILADNGYNVWLGNARGSTYSKKHVHLSIHDRQFWNFSWQELGIYDLPAVIDYISTLSGSKVFYIGHSMGGTTISTLAIERPEMLKKIKASVLLAPATYEHYMTSPVRLLAPFWKQIQNVAKVLGINQVFPRSILIDLFAKYVCKSILLRNVLCSNILFIIGGYNPDQLDYSLLPLIWSKFPAGTSVKLFVHWLQQIEANTYSKFDYGRETNLKVYNSTEPPAYDVSKVRLPTAVFWSENDALVNPKDVHRFYNQLPYKLGIHKVADKKFSHFNFIMSEDGPELLYNDVLKIMSDFENQIIQTEN